MSDCKWCRTVNLWKKEGNRSKKKEKERGKEKKDKNEEIIVGGKGRKCKMKDVLLVSFVGL